MTDKELVLAHYPEAHIEHRDGWYYVRPFHDDSPAISKGGSARLAWSYAAMLFRK